MTTFATSSDARRSPKKKCRLEFDRRLVEEAVLLAIQSAPPGDQRLFHAERDPLYETADLDRRESEFDDLHGRWFRRLRVAAPVLSVWREEPSLAYADRCLVVPVSSAKEEFADVQPDRRGSGGTVVLIRLRSPTLVDAERVVDLLRHELLHVVDILDPEFGFEPRLEAVAINVGLENLVRERYRVLWDTTIDGRLAARGVLPLGREARRHSEFQAAFSMLGEAAGSCFETLFRGPRPDHAWLLCSAADPAEMAEVRVESGGCCPLCRMPTTTLAPDPERLEPTAVEAVKRDFQDWTPAEGLCLQCADLYRSRAASMEAGRADDASARSLEISNSSALPSRSSQ